MQVSKCSLKTTKTLSCEALIRPPKNNFHTFFLKGRDENLLSRSQQKSFLKFLNQDPLSSSFLIYNQTQLLKQVAQWKNKLPWIQPFYAMKSNPIQPLVQDIHANNIGFDCASKIEIKNAFKLGTHASNIVYSNSIKEERDIYYAKKKGVKLTTADSIDELVKLQKIAPEMDVLWRLSIKENNAQNLATVFSNKFGDDIVSIKEITERFTEIRKMGIKLKGIHFHCGSGQHGSSSFQKAIDNARLCIKIGRQLGHSMEILDLGGGFPAGIFTENQINILTETYKDPLGYKVMAEPGRYFSSNSCYLATRVIGKRTKNNRECYHLNDGLYHSFNINIMDGNTFENDREQFYSQWDKKGSLVNDSLGSTLQEGSLFGMTCDGADIIAKNAFIPKMNVSDWLIFGGCGSYTYGPKSGFNGMNSTEKVIMWRSDKVKEEEILREEKKREEVKEQRTNLIMQ